MLASGKVVPLDFTAPEPPEGWPLSPAQGEEGLVSKKSLLGPQPLPQTVPL